MNFSIIFSRVPDIVVSYRVRYRPISFVIPVGEVGLFPLNIVFFTEIFWEELSNEAV
jgi:hypothetical protein